MRVSAAQAATAAPVGEVFLRSVKLLSAWRRRQSKTQAAHADVLRLKAEVQRLQCELEAANPALRRELIGNVAHDLRTPLVSLHGHLEALALRGDALPAGQRARYLAIALRQSEGLARLIDDLFALAKLDFKDVVLQREPFALDELVDGVLQKFQLQAKACGVRLHLRAARGLPFVDADLCLIERVLDNVIGNAIKHTPAGGRVHAGLRVADGHVQVRISDTGGGIAAADLPFVFDRFYRGRNEARHASGAGLGLAITRRIVELHGGRIDVASSQGEGTHFTFALPLAAAKPC